MVSLVESGVRVAMVYQHRVELGGLVENGSFQFLLWRLHLEVQEGLAHVERSDVDGIGHAVDGQDPVVGQQQLVRGREQLGSAQVLDFP